MTRAVDARSALGCASVSDFGPSRPSETNCKTGPAGADRTRRKNKWSVRQYWDKRKNALVDEFMSNYKARALRPLSVREKTKLRTEVTVERHDQGHRSTSWSGAMNAFLRWYNSYRFSHLVFRDPDGNKVRGRMVNSHMPSYGDRYYARIKALERQIVNEYNDLHIALLSLSGSMKNENGGWRCPADHMRDVVDSFRPESGSGVYHALRYSLDDKEWEYAIVLEKHKNGYAHCHIAVFVDGKVEESDFHSAIDAHLRHCDIAHWKAHNYNLEDPDERPISVRPVDTSLDLEDLDTNADDVEEITNVGSYIGEYIGAYGEKLFDRDITELMFRTTAWATGTQLVRFSTGANELINRELADEKEENQDVDVEIQIDKDTQEKSVNVKGDTGSKWTLEGIGQVYQNGDERVYRVEDSKVDFTEIKGAEHLDPPKVNPPDPPPMT